MTPSLVAGVTFIQNAQASLSETVVLVNKFLSISDYSINWNESTVLPINSMSTALLQSGNISYLGISSSARLSDLTQSPN